MLLRPQHVGFGNLPNLTSHSQKEDQGYVDSGCSRYMTDNMSYLTDFKEFDEGYVTFGVTPPKWVAAEYDVSGASLHRSIAQ
ncbi:hypothetical protein Tco_1268470, partial [Tanacetum coccineum]